ncbi:hypothetical protein GOP47_0021288 [Adiantum capillus-veneris]|uniref:Uncharacterized protein n=1 Tax=Adiantum capillus-veneris TaxID=13818 RepID=A0A9D4UBL3_ADICA|nr:hypothetical protein GOP47_0021287 [Adiantum capillus-veneris]KAI5064618.1 hypothetical protein GOP47_0021288 [Adiantum capillus-veneris]
MRVSMTHYAVLQVAEDATFAQIRASYLSSLLALHPDKLNQEIPASSGFLRLQEAWHVLKDPQSRSTYDRHLTLSRLLIDNAIADEVTLEEMSRDCDDADAAYTYPCRCGDFFTLSSQEVDEWQDMDHCRNSVDLGASESEKAHPPFVTENHSTYQDLHRHIDQSRSLILPCSSCSLQIRVLF